MAKIKKQGMKKLRSLTKIETIKKILKLNNTITELKNLIESFKTRLNKTGEKNSHLEDKAFEMTQMPESFG